MHWRVHHQDPSSGLASFLKDLRDQSVSSEYAGLTEEPEAVTFAIRICARRRGRSGQQSGEASQGCTFQS